MDASFVDVPRQRNSREENAQLKAGETPERFAANPSVKAQKDTRARWASQHSAEVHDSQKLLGVLSENTSCEFGLNMSLVP